MLLALIPARGGSKGIKNKNIKDLAGKPLIAYTIEQAIACKKIDKVIVSTDNEEIAKISKMYGAEVPFMRSPRLAEDTTPTIDVVIDVIRKIKGVTSILVLQPTSPLRSREDIDGIIEYQKKKKVESIVSITRQDKHPNWMYYIEEDMRLMPVMKNIQNTSTRRQDLQPTYILNGAMYLCTRKWIEKYGCLIGEKTEGYIMSKSNSIDIDEPIDLAIAEAIIDWKGK